MTTHVLMDELHLQVRARRDLPAAHRAALRRVLMSRSFQDRVRHAVKNGLAGRPWSAAVRVRLAQ